MPFTLAHPAIVLPITKLGKQLSLIALIVGSITPDVEFFMQFKVTGENLGHHFYGIFIFDLPVSFLLYVLFIKYVRTTIMYYLPNFVQVKLWCFFEEKQSNKTAVMVLISLLVGILSHLFLDAFTHEDGLFYSQFPHSILVVQLNGHLYQLYDLLQYGFSLIGCGIIYFVTFSQKDASQFLVQNVSKKFFWIFYSVLICTLLIIRIIVMPDHLKVLDLVMAIMGITMLSVLFTCLAFYKTIKQEQWQFL